MTYEISTLRIMQAFSFNSWRLIEMLLHNKVCINDINPTKLVEIMKIILPNGQSFLNLLVKKVNL